MEATEDIPSIPKNGISLPTDRNSLMKALNGQKADANFLRNQRLLNQQLKSDLANETVERKLMGLEDYIGTLEGERRLERYNEEIKMLEEDEFSRSIEDYYKDLNLEKFREKIRLEVEERKRQEELERLKKRKAAEARRAAVLERIRKKEEAAAEAKRKLEEAQRLAEEEEQREILKEQERLDSNRLLMCTEDEMSSLYGEKWKEEDALKAIEEAEAKKMADWEAQEAEKALKEEESRAERLKILKLKREKLKAMQEQQGVGMTHEELAQKRAAAKADAVRASKQVGIQNKARNLQKKMKEKAKNSNNNNNNDDGNTSPINISVPMSPARTPKGAFDTTINIGTPGIINITTNTPSFAHLTESTTAEQHGTDIATLKSTTIPQEFLDTLSTMNEGDLRTLQKELMTEKRRLRLEQRQLLGSDLDEEEKETRTIQIKNKVVEITLKEKEVKTALKKISITKAENVDNTNSMSSPQKQQQQQQQQQPWKSESEVKDGITPVDTTTDKGTSAVVVSAEIDSTTTTVQPDSQSQQQQQQQQLVVVDKEKERLNTLSSQAETLLQEATSIIDDLKFEGNSRNSSSGTRINDSTINIEDKSSHDLIARSGVLLLTMTDASRKLQNYWRSKSRNDPLDYSNKLSLMATTLKNEVDKAVAASTTTTTTTTTVSTIPLSEDANLAAISKTPSIETTTLTKSQEKEEKAGTFTSSSSSPSLVLNVAVNPDNANPNPNPNVAVNPDNASKPGVGVGIEEDTQENVAIIVLNQNEISDNVDDKMITPRKDVTLSANPSTEKDNNDNKTDTTDVIDNDNDFENLPGWNSCINTSMTTAAHHAAYYNHIKVLDFLSQNFDVFITDSNGRTPLYYAAMQNNLECVINLVSIDAGWLDVGDINGETCLHASVQSDNLITTEVLNFLLSCEANPDTANHNGLTPCHLAQSKSALEILYYAGATPYCVDTLNRMPLWYACERGDVDCVSFLCSVTPSEYMLYGDDNGDTPLHIAASKGHQHCVELLCQWMSGVDDLYVTNKKGQHAAHVASNANVLKCLYENGADLWTQDNKGRYPLFVCSLLGFTDCVCFLLDVGVSSGKWTCIESGDFQGDTALHAACLMGRLQVVSLLLFFLTNTANQRGLTPLNLAKQAGHDDVARMVHFLDQCRIANPASKSSEIYQTSFEDLVTVVSYYGSRWAKLYDSSTDSIYYFDRITGFSSWERPETYDLDIKLEKSLDTARNCLRKFYLQYNPSKLHAMNDILHIYKEKYTDLFVELAERYEIQDLTIFQGVYID